MAYDPRRIRRLVIFNAVARQTDGYEAEEAALRARLLSPLVQALDRGLVRRLAAHRRPPS